MIPEIASPPFSGKIGFTGKIPDNADYVARFLPPSFTSYWNGWIDEGMQASKHALGDDWRPAFLVAPVWHFSILPGLIGETGWIGVVIPSVDKTGRYYPLTVVSSCFFHCHHQPDSELLHHRLEAIAIAALDEGSSIQTLEDLCLQEELIQNETVVLNAPAKNTPNLLTRSTLRLNIAQETSSLSLSGPGIDPLLNTGACFWSSGSPFLQSAVHYFAALPTSDFFASLLKDEGSLAESIIPFSHPHLQGRKIDVSVVADHFITHGTWQSSARTDPGQRSINQDALLQLPDCGLWAVADGMGGHALGERASQLVINLLCQLPKARYLETHLGRVIKLLTKANEELQSVSEKELGGRVTGTTFVGLITDGACAYVVWVGDSRIYRLRRGELELLTVDHTTTNSQGRTALARAVGGARQLEIDTRFITVESTDHFLLCSDGLYRSVNEHEMASLLLTGDLDQKADALMDLALKRDAKDNVSLIVLQNNHGVGEDE